jgi:WD40 repeat protein
MSLTGSDTTLADYIRPVLAGSHVSATAFLGGTAAFALGDGTIILANGENTSRINAHNGAAILAAASDGKYLVTGGDDGRVVRTNATGKTEEVAKAANGAWIDAVALGPDGAVAWSAAKKAHVRDGKGAVFSLDLPSSGRGLCFAPKGFQLYVARYNGVTLWFPRTQGTQGTPKEIFWKGSHLDVTASADGRFVVSTMQENEMHGWRLADSGNMRMSGYPSKVRSMAWSFDGKWLASSGADAAIVWPFMTKDGPMGKPPLELGIRPSRVERVAFHPAAPVLAVGYKDGCVWFIRMDDESILQARAAGDGGPITALSWNSDGMMLAFGTEEGAAGVLTLPKV